MGRLTHFRQLRNQHTAALDISAQLIVSSATFIPAYLEKLHILLAMSAWDQCIETSQRVLAQDSESIEGLFYMTLIELVRGIGGNGIEYIVQLRKAVEKTEPGNLGVALQCVRPLLRVSGRNPKCVFINLISKSGF